MKSLLAAGVLAAMLFGSATQAEDLTKRGGFLLRGDFEFGGDELLTVDFEDGESQDIRAGQGISGGVGGWFRPIAGNPFEIQALIGLKYVTTAAENADINVSRTVLKVDALYRFENDWWTSIGLTHHAGAELDGDGFFEDISFDDATGVTFGAGWKWIGLEYTKIEYSSEFYQDVDASSIGVSFTYRFGAR
jgi:hypothetical protein